jgi:hypothetical protein
MRPPRDVGGRGRGGGSADADRIERRLCMRARRRRDRGRDERGRAEQSAGGGALPPSDEVGVVEAIRESAMRDHRRVLGPGEGGRLLRP